MVWRCKRRDPAASLFGLWLRRFCHNTTSPILLRQKNPNFISIPVASINCPPKLHRPWVNEARGKCYNLSSSRSGLGRKFGLINRASLLLVRYLSVARVREIGGFDFVT